MTTGPTRVGRWDVASTLATTLSACIIKVMVIVHGGPDVGGSKQGYLLLGDLFHHS